MIVAGQVTCTLGTKITEPALHAEVCTFIYKKFLYEEF